MFDIFYIDKAPGLFPHETRVDSEEEAMSLSRTRFFWMINYLSDYDSWDFLWEPVPWQAHQRHAWRSHWQKDSGTYLIPKNGYEQTNYHDDKKIIRNPSRENWSIPENIDPDSVDFTWHPCFSEPPYEYHFPSQHQRASGVVYKSTSSIGIKFCEDFLVHAIQNKKHWFIPEWIKDDSIDYTWHPDFLDPPCIYHFQTKWGWNRIGGPEYRMPGAVGVKYLDCIVADTISKDENWYIPDWIDINSIDKSWVPDPGSPPFNYEFPVEWGWDKIGGPEYRVPGAIEKKYCDAFVAKTLPSPENFEILDNISMDDDVLRWRPNPSEAPYVYVFGNQWWPGEKRASVIFRSPGATQIKFVNDVLATRIPVTDNYKFLYDSEFDTSWEPDPGDPPYIYVVGNQWHAAEKMPTVEFHVPGATERKYLDEPKACLPSTNDHWKTIVDCEWNYSWVPDPGDPPYIYVFGNQWHAAEKMPTVEFHVPGATERKYLDQPIAGLPQKKDNWSVPEDLDASKIDFSWIPDPGDPPYIYHFGSEHQRSSGLVYTVPGASEIKFVDEIPLLNDTKSALQALSIFYLDKSNPLSKRRFEKLKERYPEIQKIRYVNSLMDTIQRCADKANTNRFWIISSENEYDDFDFTWHPASWQTHMTHVFGTQWNKWSDTFMIDKREFFRNIRWCNSIEEFPNLNFVVDQKVYSSSDSKEVFLIDHGNDDLSKVEKQISSKGISAKVVRYHDNYLDTLTRIVNSVPNREHIWVISSVCDYENFDFSWQPDIWQKDMLHVFASGSNKFGDTFFVPIKKFQEQNPILLDWFETINYCDHQRVSRWPIPVIKHDNDTHIYAIKQHDWKTPFVIFDNGQGSVRDVPDISLWRNETKIVTYLSKSGTKVVVPRQASTIKDQIYDYPYVDNQSHIDIHEDKNLDIIFLSNGEPNADQNWSVLLHHTKGLSNRCIRVDGISGRVRSQHAAAEAANTDWYFVVPAKLEVIGNFDWSYQPDRLQQSKHYVFHALNPVNQLEYGHQAMILYNKKLVLANVGKGLDFTLDDAHQVVPLMSGVARYNIDAWTAWRTAFREVIKLKHSLPDVENEYRISQWCMPGSGANCYWSSIGAQDALEYYEEVDGDFEELKKSYEWSWLFSYAAIKRNFNLSRPT
jgi:hypothetical protein